MLQELSQHLFIPDIDFIQLFVCEKESQLIFASYEIEIQWK